MESVSTSSPVGADRGGTAPPASESLESLLLPLLRSAYNTAFRLTRNGADAEDLVQEAALLACRGFSSFAPGTNFKAWFFRILTNAFFSKYRRRQREGVTVDLDAASELCLYSQTAGIGLHARVDDPGAALMDRLDGEHIAEALDRLPDEYRVVATLYFIDDMAYQDIASALDIPIGTVRSRLHRSRRMLQQALWTIARDRGIVDRLLAEGGAG